MHFDNCGIIHQKNNILKETMNKEFITTENIQLMNDKIESLKKINPHIETYFPSNNELENEPEDELERAYNNLPHIPMPTSSKPLLGINKINKTNKITKNNNPNNLNQYKNQGEVSVEQVNIQESIFNKFNSLDDIKDLYVDYQYNIQKITSLRESFEILFSILFFSIFFMGSFINFTTCLTLLAIMGGVFLLKIPKKLSSYFSMRRTEQYTNRQEAVLYQTMVNEQFQFEHLMHIDRTLDKIIIQKQKLEKQILDDSMSNKTIIKSAEEFSQFSHWIKQLNLAKTAFQNVCNQLVPNSENILNNFIQNTQTIEKSENFLTIFLNTANYHEKYIAYKENQLTVEDKQSNNSTIYKNLL